MKTWFFPLRSFSGSVPRKPHLGAFGAIRKYHQHEGVDLYAPINTPVFAVERGRVITVEPFTGPTAGSPWWHDTMCVMVEGPSGVVNYGEIVPTAEMISGRLVYTGTLIGWIKQVLKKDKGLPMSMLHLELYSPGTTTPVEWKVGDQQPPHLLDPTQLLLSAQGP